MNVILRKLYRFAYFCWHVCKRFFKDDCMYRASALTYTTLLALVPLMTVGFSIFMAVPKFKDWGFDVQNFIFNNFVPESGKVVQSYLQGFVQQAHNLSLIGMVFLVVTAVLMLFTIEQTLNHIWRVDNPRRGMRAFLMYWAILTISPLLVGASIALSTYFMSLNIVATTIQNVGFSGFLLPLIPFVLLVIAFTILYSAIPNCKVPVRFSVLGAIFAAVLFSAAKYGFTLYLTNFPTYKLLYGTFAVVPIFLIWVYLIWLIILFGAELTHSLTFRHILIPERTVDGFTHAFLWLGYLWQAQQQGRVLGIQDLAKMDKLGYQVSPEKLLRRLLDSKLIAKTPSGNYFLKRDLSTLSLLEFHYLIPWTLPKAVPAEVKNPWCKPLDACLQQVDGFLQQKASMPLSEFYNPSD